MMLSKKQLIALGIIVIVAALGYLFTKREKGVSIAQAPASATSTLTAAAPKTSATTTAPKPDTGGSHPGLSYGEAVSIYTNRRMQFDENCVATPNYIVVKNGTNFMFDNRSKNGRSIALDGTKYYLRGYDFRILTLKSSRLPHTVIVDCSSGKNNAKIILN